MAGNAIDELVNTLYQMVQDAGNLPLMADRCIIEREKTLDILDEVRANMPSDLKMAREILEKRNEVMQAGKREADTIRKQAEDAATRKINENDIMLAARKKAAEIISTAEGRARELMSAANSYCDDAMKRTEDAVAQALTEIKTSRATLSQITKQSRED